MAAADIVPTAKKPLASKGRPQMPFASQPMYRQIDMTYMKIDPIWGQLARTSTQIISICEQAIQSSSRSIQNARQTIQISGIAIRPQMAFANESDSDGERSEAYADETPEAARAPAAAAERGQGRPASVA